MARTRNKSAEQALLAALAIGATVENAARKAGMSERTAYRHLADPAFQARVDQVRRENMARTAGMLSGRRLGIGEDAGRIAQDVLGAGQRASRGGPGRSGDGRQVSGVRRDGAACCIHRGSAVAGCARACRRIGSERRGLEVRRMPEESRRRGPAV